MITENKYLCLTVIFIYVTCSYGYVNYEIFHGFEDTTHHHHHHRENVTQRKDNHSMDTNVTTTPKSINITVSGTTTSTTEVFSNNTTFTEHKEIRGKIKCPETEKPFNIGTYEVPTHRDLVLFTKRTLTKLFNSYHKKALFLLKDIKEATRYTVDVEKKCYGVRKIEYKKCVRDVSKKCVLITKDLVASLEKQEAEVRELTEDQVCDMTKMKTDPIQLIKRLAMDEAMSDFALPAFLRLLGGCSMHCQGMPIPDLRPRLRQMTDQELVVRHFLTSKNYIQLIKDTTRYV